MKTPVMPMSSPPRKTRVGGLLGRLKVRHQILSGYLSVAIAFLVVLGLLLAGGQRTWRLLERIEHGEVPALNLRRDLEVVLGDYQRSLQDAAATEDLEALAGADKVRDIFLAKLAGGKQNEALDPVLLEALAAEFDGYSVLARRTTAGLIERGPDERLLADLRAMTDSYSGIKRQLNEATVRQSEDLGKAFADARDRQWALVVGGATLLVVVMILLAGFSVLLVRHLDRSLGQAMQAARALAQGDVGFQISVESRDELGALLISMRRMTDYLREMAGAADAIAGGDFTGRITPRSERDVFGNALERMSTNLGRMIGRMKAASERVRWSAARISAAAQEIEEGAEGQSVATDQTSTTMVEMATQVESVSRSMGALAGTVEATSSSMHEIGVSIEVEARHSDDVLSSVEQSVATVEGMAASIEAIAGKVDLADRVTREGAELVQKEGLELSRLMQAIGSSSQDIGRIVDLNHAIAKKTRLLAFNAAVEAAKAGEAGMGIGVVAEEVKKLAEQAADSTRQIEGYVETVRKATGNALLVTQTILDRILDSVTKSTDLVREVMMATQEHRQGTADVLTTSAHMSNTTRQMAEAVREQAGGARHILSAVVEMSEMTQSVAQASEQQKEGGAMIVESVEQIARIAHEHLAAAESLSDATLSLAEEARVLREMSDQFRLAPGPTPAQPASVDTEPGSAVAEETAA